MGILLATAPQLHHVRVKLRVDPDENDNGAEEREKNDMFFETLWSAWMQCTGRVFSSENQLFIQHIKSPIW